MISSLQRYITSIRPAYLALEPLDWLRPETTASHHPPSPTEKGLTDDERHQINHSITKFIREYELAISNLASAEALRQQTQATVLRRKFPLKNSRLWKWAAGGGARQSAKSQEQETLEAIEATLTTVRENVLWSLRRGLEVAIEMQREMVERRIQQVQQQEFDMMKMISRKKEPSISIPGAMPFLNDEEERTRAGTQDFAYMPDVRDIRGKGGDLDAQATAELQTEMSQEQLQIFEQENQGLLQSYEDTLSKVQYVKSAHSWCHVFPHLR